MKHKVTVNGFIPPILFILACGVLITGGAEEGKKPAKGKESEPRRAPGYPECVAMLVQIGDHLSKQYDVKG